MWKADLRLQIKIKVADQLILKQEDECGLSRWAQSSHQGLWKVEEGSRSQERFDDFILLALKTERSQAKECRWPLEAGKISSPPEPPGRNTALLMFWFQLRWVLFWTFDLLNYKIIHCVDLNCCSSNKKWLHHCNKAFNREICLEFRLQMPSFLPVPPHTNPAGVVPEGHGTHYSLPAGKLCSILLPN